MSRAARRLERALADDCPLASREGGFIRDGFSAELDSLRELMAGGKQWIARYQAEESARAGIPSLKVGFNKVFGYYLEITNAHSAKIPPHYIRKQTVKNAERYITPDLKEHEERVLAAEEQSQDLEYRLFVELREMTAAAAGRLLATAAVLAELDVLVAMAELARSRGYCRPSVVAEPLLDIRDGRHPVLDATIAAGSFVPNDVACGGEAGTTLLVTGPNMAGKSTFIRQVALITLMAQCGSFVPAKRATIGVADRIFARVGASDELARGRSTFMVEMTETARILNTATPRSLVILDEIGRGTSTYDGLSLAWAVVEHLHDKHRLPHAVRHALSRADGAGRIACRTCGTTTWPCASGKTRSCSCTRSCPAQPTRATASTWPGWPACPAAWWNGPSNCSAQLENEQLDVEGRPKLARRGRKIKAADLQLTLFAAEEPELVSDVRKIKLDETTPLAALEFLQRWQEKLGGGRRPEAGGRREEGKTRG